MRKSRIFANKELEILEKRIAGGKCDTTGAWSRNIKPKIREILHEWLRRKPELEKALQRKKRCKK